MAKTRKGSEKKRRTRGHVISDLAANHVDRLVLLSGHTMHRITHDYGLDAAVTTYNAKGEVENGVIWMQFKASDRPKRTKDGSAFTARVQRKDLLHWMGELYPVILIIYDASQDRAFWLCIQEEYAGGKIFGLARAGASVTLHIPLKRALTGSAIREFRRLKTIAHHHWTSGAPNHG